MSGPVASQAIDAGQLLGALRQAEVVGHELRSLALERAWPWRSEGLCALHLDRQASPGQREWTVLQEPTARLPRRLRRSEGRGGPLRLPALGAWIVPPAGDPELPVAELLDGAVAASRLRRWLGDAGPARRLEVRARGYKPLRRLTVEYRHGEGSDAGFRLYGKALRRRDLGGVEASCEALKASAATDLLVLPRAVERRWNMLLFDARSGTGLDRLIPGPAASRAVALAGEALAALHTSGARLPAAHPRERELETLDRWLGCAARTCPEMCARLTAARRGLKVAAGGAVGEPVPGHRDYHPGQLLVAPGGASVLDLDTAAMVEAELDAGNFLAHLDLFELQRRSVPRGELEDAFRRAYEGRAGRQLDARRLYWYRAAAVLRLACVYRFRPRGAVLGALLTRRCLELLDSGATSLEVI